MDGRTAPLAAAMATFRWGSLGTYGSLKVPKYLCNIMQKEKKKKKKRQEKKKD